MSVSSLRIVVTGLAATYPFGGVFWDYMQYLLGLFRLGHDVWYIEDTGKWCYDPQAATFVEDGSHNAQYLARQIELMEPGLRDRWFYRDTTGRTFGRTWEEIKCFCRSADLFLHISASCWMRDEYFAAQRVAFIDSDPMYTQSSVPPYLMALSMRKPGHGWRCFVSTTSSSPLQKILRHQTVSSLQNCSDGFRRDNLWCWSASRRLEFPWRPDAVY